MIRYMLFLALGIALCVGLWRYAKALSYASKRILEFVVLATGFAMAMAIGTQTHLIFPSLGSLGLGAGLGAFIGSLVWLIVGTLGIVPLGIAFGLWSMVATAMGLSVMGSLVGGLGFKTALVPYVPFTLWLPMLVTGLFMRRARRARPSILVVLEEIQRN